MPMKPSSHPRGWTPSAGTGKQMQVRLHTPFISQLDQWIEKQGEWMSRPEALRRLARIGLTASGQEASDASG